jgi:chromosome partitioning protein
MITNALYIATDVIIPCATDGFSLEGLRIIIDKLKTAKEDYADNLERYAVLWTRVDKRQNLSKQLIEAGDRQLSSFDTVIRESVRVRESTVESKPVVVYEPSCNPSVDYRNLTTEIIDWAN